MKLGRILTFIAVGLLLSVAVAHAAGYDRFLEVIGMGGAGGAVLGMALGDGGAAAAEMQRPKVYPFRQNTRQKQAIVAGTLTYALGGRAQLTLPQIGYLSRIWLRANLTYDLAGASAPAKFAPYSIFSNVRVDLNSNKHILCDASGYQLFLLNSVRRKNARLDQNTDSDFYNYPVAGAGNDQVLRTTLEIPIAVSNGQNFLNGLINLQAPELQCNLTVQFNSAASDIGSNASGVEGTVDVVYEYYQVPDPSAVQQPYLGLHKILSQTEPIVGTGENIHKVPRGGKILRLIHVLELNGARSDAFDSQEIRLNNSESVYFKPRWQAKFQNRQMYGYALPTGTIVWDNMNAWDICEESDQRDVFNTENVTTTESRIIVTAGSTLGSNNNFLHTLREVYQVPE